MNKNNVIEKHRGQGSYGYVNQVKDCNLGIVYAEKHLNLKKAKSKEKKRFINEYNIMHKYNHENLVKSYSIDKENYTYIMEYCDSTLENYIKANNNKLEFSIRKDLAIQLLNGLSYIHSKGIFHRDLAYSNILIKKYDNSLKLKIADFGLAKDLNEPITNTSTDQNRGHFVDPLLDNFKKFNVQNEMYAIGFILHYIFRGKSSLNLESETNEQLKNIIHKCTTTDSIKKRYRSIDELLKDINNLEQFETTKKENKKNYKWNKTNYKINLLNEAYNSQDKSIWYNKFLTGQSLDAGNKHIPLDELEPRDKEEYIFAFNDLLKDGIFRLEYSGKGNKKYVLTKYGYEYYKNNIK